MSLSDDAHSDRSRRVLPPVQDASCTPWQPPAINSRGRGLHTVAAELQAKHEQAEARGYEEGLARARQEIQEELARQRAAFERVMDLLCQPLANVDPEVEHAVANLSLEIGQQLFQHELNTRPETIAGLVTAALALVSDTETKLTLHLNPEDYALVKDSLAHLWEDGRVSPQADPELTPGGCLVRGAFSAADATCETRMAAIRDIVLSGLPQLEKVQVEEDAPGSED